MEFGKSGTGTIYFDYPDDPADSETFTWTLSGTTLTLITTDDPDETGTYKVERLTSSELVLSMSESGTDDGVAWEYYDRNTFKKLK